MEDVDEVMGSSKAETVEREGNEPHTEPNATKGEGIGPSNVLLEIEDLGHIDTKYEIEYCESDDEIGDLVSDEDDRVDDGILRKPKFLRFDLNRSLPKIELEMLFHNAKQFRHAVDLHAVHSKRYIKWSKNHKLFMRGHCSVEGCPMYIYGA